MVEEQPAINTLLQDAIKASKLHQRELANYAQRLEDEIALVEQLVDAAEYDDEGETETATIEVPGAKKAVSFIPASHFLSPESPFYEEASRRTRYLNAITIHPMTKKELEALEEGVKESNHRRLAFEAKRNGKLLWDVDVSDLLSNTEGLDWSRIAEKVSDVSGHPRTARDCESRWIGDRHPGLKHDAWDRAESIKMAELLDAYDAAKPDWKEISAKLDTGRSPFECMRHGTSKPHHYWDTKSDEALREAVDTYGLDNWNLVARHVSPQATASQCHARFTKTLDSRVRKGAWSDEEDERLRVAVETYGNNWLDVASVMHGRINEQCRERWVSTLDPALKKAPWTEEEDAALMAAFNDIGKKWAQLSRQLKNGRTDSQCRRRVEQLLKQKQNEDKAAEKAAAVKEKARLAEEKAKLAEERRLEAQKRKQEAKQRPNFRFMQPQTSGDLGQQARGTSHHSSPPTFLAGARILQQTPVASQQGMSVVVFEPDIHPAVTSQSRPTPRRIPRAPEPSEILSTENLDEMP